MAYTRKTRDEFWVQQDFGYGDGWETVSAYATRKDARECLKEYRQNQPEYPVRVVTKRVRL